MGRSKHSGDKSIWKKSEDSLKIALPKAQAEAARKQENANKAFESFGKKKKKKVVKKNPLMKGKIDRTPRSGD